MTPGEYDDHFADDDEFDDEERECWECRGEGVGIVGDDFYCLDAINGPYEGEAITCPNCRGSGLAKDCTYW